MEDRIRMPLRFEPVCLQQDLERLLDDDWINHFVRQNYEGIWSVIPLRGPAGEQHPIRMIYSDPGCTAFEDTPYLRKCPYFQLVLAAFQCPLMAVRLMNLTAGSQIKEHTDHELSLEEGTVRLHIPVTTNAAVDFRLNGSPVTMNAGECWYLRLSDPHAVVNRGATDRVHLVIDATVNDWLTGLL